MVGYGAPGQLVGENGAVIPLTNKEQLTKDYTRELEALAVDAERRIQRAESARECAVTHYTWDAKAKKPSRYTSGSWANARKTMFYEQIVKEIAGLQYPSELACKSVK